MAYKAHQSHSLRTQQIRYHVITSLGRYRRLIFSGGSYCVGRIERGVESAAIDLEIHRTDICPCSKYSPKIQSSGLGANEHQSVCGTEDLQLRSQKRGCAGEQGWAGLWRTCHMVYVASQRDWKSHTCRSSHIQSTEIPGRPSPTMRYIATRDLTRRLSLAVFYVM